MNNRTMKVRTMKLDLGDKDLTKTMVETPLPIFPGESVVGFAVVGDVAHVLLIHTPASEARHSQVVYDRPEPRQGHLSSGGEFVPDPPRRNPRPNGGGGFTRV